MTEKNKSEENTANSKSNKSKDLAKGVKLVTQYLKDLSFENPKFPVISKEKERPKIEIAINVDVDKKKEDLYEVRLLLNAKANVNNGDVYFLVELSYGGLFQISNLSEQELQSTLLVYCPTLLFPYARRIISDVTRDGGLPPLMLDPVDFAFLYKNRLQDEMKKKEKEKTLVQ